VLGKRFVGPFFVGGAALHSRKEGQAVIGVVVANEARNECTTTVSLLRKDLLFRL
jgi:hypothetical protein